MQPDKDKPKFDLQRLALRLALSVCIAAGIIPLYFLLTRRFETQIHDFFLSLRLLILILTPVFIIVALCLFTHDQGSTVSILAFMCLLLYAFNGYFLILEMFGASIDHDDPSSTRYLLRILIADILVAALATASLVKNYLQEKRLAQIRDSWTREDEEDEPVY